MVFGVKEGDTYGYHCAIKFALGSVLLLACTLREEAAVETLKLHELLGLQDC